MQSHQGHLRDDVLYVHTDYLRNALFNRPAILARAAETLKKEAPEFDTIVGTGFSGALVIPELAGLMEKHFLLVRKDLSDASTHSPFAAEGALGRRWLFVDDKITSGATRNRVRAVIRLIQEWSGQYETTEVGAYTYENDWFTPAPAGAPSEPLRSLRPVVVPFVPRGAGEVLGTDGKQTCEPGSCYGEDILRGIALRGISAP